MSIAVLRDFVRSNANPEHYYPPGTMVWTLDLEDPAWKEEQVLIECVYRYEGWRQFEQMSVPREVLEGGMR